jgi:lipopolysaccharide transport system permease protein
MAGVVDGFRWALLGSSPVSLTLMLVSFIVVIVVLISGLFYFRRMEETFADVV